MSTELTFSAAQRLRLGLHRVVDPIGALPQAAWALDNAASWPDPVAVEHELLLSVERLNVDAASFLQMEQAARGAEEAPEEGIRRRVLETLSKRGKLHNPVTGSGGMLLGRVLRIGNQLPSPHRDLQVGERIATLVSLSLTPLHLTSIDAVHLATHQLTAQGTAVLFASGAWARIPSWLPENVALSAFDVAGAGPQVARLCRERSLRRVLILGAGGKSGLLAAAASRQSGAELVVGIENHPVAAQDARALGYYDHLLQANAAQPTQLAELALAASGAAYDLVISCVSSPGAEMAAILCTRPRGMVYFFSMATSFTAAALGAEGVGKDIDLLIGNGFCEGHAEATLALLKTEPALCALFVRRYGR